MVALAVALGSSVSAIVMLAILIGIALGKYDLCGSVEGLEDVARQMGDGSGLQGLHGECPKRRMRSKPLPYRVSTGFGVDGRSCTT